MTEEKIVLETEEIYLIETTRRCNHCFNKFTGHYLIYKEDHHSTTKPRFCPYCGKEIL